MYVCFYIYIYTIQEGNGYLYTLPHLPNLVAFSFLTNNSQSSDKALVAAMITAEDEETVESPKAQSSSSNFRTAYLSKLKIIDKSK